MEQKKEMRSRIRQIKKQYTAEQLQHLSEAACARLKENSHIRNAGVVMLYYSLPDEVCTHKLIRELSAEGKKILLPAVIDEENMELREYRDDSDLKTGAYGILEPAGPLFEKFDDIDVAVVPGMMFDKNGNRLGRGKGYYDRFLKRIGDVCKIGLCFDFQVAPAIPCEENDVRVDELVF